MLDPWWVANVIFHPRHTSGSDAGQLIISPKERPSECASLEEFYRKVWERDGFPPWRIKQMWKELSEKIPQKSAMRPVEA